MSLSRVSSANNLVISNDNYTQNNNILIEEREGIKTIIKQANKQTNKKRK